MKRMSTVMATVPPTRSNWWVWSTRKSLAWNSGFVSPISSRKTVSPCASSRRPFFSWCAPVNAPFSWPNSSVSRRPSASATQFTATNGLDALGAVVVDRAATRRAPDESDTQALAGGDVDGGVEPLAVAEGDGRRLPGEEADRGRRRSRLAAPPQRLVDRHVGGAVGGLGDEQAPGGHHDCSQGSTEHASAGTPPAPEQTEYGGEIGRAHV